MFARTKRLTLRPGWPEDAPALTQAIAHHDVARRLSQVPWPYTVDDAAAWLAMPRGTADVALLVFDHEEYSPRLVGCISLMPRDEGLTLGYWYTPSVWGRGYATEAGLVAVAMARHALGADRLASQYHLDNPASGKVLRKLGFHPTGEVRSVFSRAQACDVPTAMMQRDLASSMISAIAA